jgi:hypothetical protein
MIYLFRVGKMCDLEESRALYQDIYKYYIYKNILYLW